MCAVANHHAQYTLPPFRTTRYVGMTITGQARQNVAIVTNRVSPAPRSANANVTLTESASEYVATHTSSHGTTAATAANSSADRPPSKTDTISPGIVRYTRATAAMYPAVHLSPV